MSAAELRGLTEVYFIEFEQCNSNDSKKPALGGLLLSRTGQLSGTSTGGPCLISLAIAKTIASAALVPA